MKRVCAAVALLALVALAGAGCYTVLRHPTDVTAASSMSTYRTCSDCHADAAYYHPYYVYGRSHYGWNAYYGYPWWYEDYWWWHPHDDHEGDGRDVETGSRHLWGSGGWASGGWGFASPPPGSGQAPPSVAPDAPRNPARPVNSSKAPPTPKRPSSKEDEKEKKEKREKKGAEPATPEKRDDERPRWRPADVD